jgi:polysaccharide export outer membrane protein
MIRKHSNIRWAASLAAMFSLAVAVGAQVSPAPNSSKAKGINDGASVPDRDIVHSTGLTMQGAYLIGPSDVLAITVWKDAELSRSMPVRPDGMISLPLIGEIQASGRTADQLKFLIAEKLKDYIATPEVTVVVLEIKSRSFNVIGKVAKPGSFDITKPLTVLDAIALAGGFQDFAKLSRICVLRHRTDGSLETLPFNYKRVIKGNDLQQNLQLQPGDTVVVP